VTTPPPPPAPPPMPAAAAGGTDRTTLWGWLGIIIGLLCCGVLGIIFGVLSILDANKYGNSKVLGIVAIVVSVVNMVVGAIAGVTADWDFNTNNN
jgi:predicted lipid-binding transport protein (Tim44 family)